MGYWVFGLAEAYVCGMQGPEAEIYYAVYDNAVWQIRYGKELL